MSQDFIKQGDETVTLNLGGIVNQFGTSVKLNGPGLDGTNIDLENSGLKKTLSSFDVGGTWRFLSRNRIDASFFSANRSGSGTIDRELIVDGVVVPINSTLTTQAKDQFFEVDYRYSFVKTDAVEVAGLLGVYGGQFKFHFSATHRLDSGDEGSVLDATASTTVPLPLIGATVDWYINPQWKISGTLSGLKAHIGNVDGSAFIGGVSTEYMLVRNFGIGAAYTYTDLNVDVTKDSFNGNLAWKLNAISLYGQVKF